MSTWNQHTPGPWTTDANGNTQASVVLSNNGGSTVARVAMGPARNANARLIAAAPELLAALKAVMAGQIGGDPDMAAERFQMARTAIARAEGHE